MRSYMSNFMVRHCWLAVLAPLVGGCGGKPPPQFPTPPRQQMACDVRMRVGHTDGEGTFEATDSDGYAGVCIKHPGEEFGIPLKIQMRSNNLDRYLTGSGWLVFRENWTPVCVEGTEEPEGKSIRTCQWNFAYRAKFPMDITIQTGNPHGLAEFLSAILVYENGKLVTAWDRTSLGSSFTISHEALDGGNLPFDAPLDVHFIPAGVQVDTAQLKSELGSWRVNQLERVGGAALQTLKEGVVANDPLLASAFQCFEDQTRILRGQLAKLFNGTPEPVVALGPACARPQVATDQSLVGEYEKLKNQGVEAVNTGEKVLEAWLVARETEISKAIGVSNSTLRAAAEPAKAGLEATIAQLRGEESTAKAADRPEIVRKILDAELALRELDAKVKQALTVADDFQRTVAEGRALYGRIIANAKDIGESKARQARLFGHFVGRLDDPFVPREANPIPVDHAEAMRLVYREHFQTFGFAPWTGVPIRISGPDMGASLQAANLVPILDILGFRWQWGSSRFSEFRLVPFGWIFFPDKRAEQPSGQGQPETTTDVFSTGPQFNVSFANFRVGALVVIGQERQPADRFRLLLGADLYKLISGQNAEVATNPL